ncbi:hypothetical protein MKZ38_004473 [Zalerion maritima]|uniref:Uncharacterized protein n=1 Tax=Zalerion maritima TaxID=339359 RepID=A0AAD5RLJ0_9PEZI|nr:hypothetical protein MKZ38_004473 [Zalerion maritima]
MARSAAFILLVVSLAACALVGGYGTLVVGSLNGFFEALGASADLPDPSERYMPGGPVPFTGTWTGFEPLDGLLRGLVSFFSSAIDGAQTWDVTLSYHYIMLNFFCGWNLLVLESFRAGNQGRAVSWITTVGMILQTITYTITVPVYLIVYLFTSPIVGSSSPRSIVPAASQARLIPMSSFLSFAVPAVLMALPSPSVIPPALHYGFIALWQPFPLFQRILQWAFQFEDAKASLANTKPSGHLEVASVTYKMILVVSILAHVGLTAVALIPGSSVPESWAPIFDEVNIRSAFVPQPLWSPPSVDATAIPVPDELAPLARFLLQFDCYCGNTAILLWALYMSSAWLSTSQLVRTTLVWGVLGGPAAASAALFWKRDSLAVEALETKKD